MAGAGRQQPLGPSRVLGGSTEKMLRGRKDVGKDRVARIGKCWFVLTGATAESHNTLDKSRRHDVNQSFLDYKACLK